MSPSVTSADLWQIGGVNNDSVEWAVSWNAVFILIRPAEPASIARVIAVQRGRREKKEGRKERRDQVTPSIALEKAILVEYIFSDGLVFCSSHSVPTYQQSLKKTHEESPAHASVKENPRSAAVDLIYPILSLFLFPLYFMKREAERDSRLVGRQLTEALVLLGERESDAIARASDLGADSLT